MSLSFSVMTRRPPVGSAVRVSVSSPVAFRGGRLALDASGLYLELREGEICQLRGPNGCGKSTLLQAIAGLIPLQCGAVRLFGRDATRMSADERARAGVALLLQRGNVFPSLTVDENLRVAAGDDGPARFDEHFARWRGHLAPGKPAALLSGGQRQRLAWAMTVLRPSVTTYLLDEVDAGMDLPVDELLATLPPSATVLMVSHEVDRESVHDTIPYEDGAYAAKAMALPGPVPGHPRVPEEGRGHGSPAGHRVGARSCP